MTLGQNVPKLDALHLMDGIEGLRSLPKHSVDMLLTDPPYGTTRNFWDVPLPLQELWEALVDKAAAAANQAVRQDGARAVIFGCTCMSTAVDGVKRKLQEHGIDIPVIEPFRAALYDALSCALMGVSQSKYAYWPVEEKTRKVDWELT